jgi:ABC-type polar amino acid transport system ATPase subunit
VSLADVSVSWQPAGSGPEPGQEGVLHGVTMAMQRGKLTMLVGSVASGRSTVLRSILGETRLTKGNIRLDTALRGQPLSYAMQQPWIETQTIRETILFGRPFDMLRYSRTIAACSLTRDLECLRDGDSTVLAEGGASVSGGQRQRLALARAVYADCPLYIFDEPMSALDAEVSKWVFDHVLGPGGVLKGRTRIVATHQIQFASLADYIYVMHEGRVIHEGTHAGEQQARMSCTQVGRLPPNDVACIAELAARGVKLEHFIDAAKHFKSPASGTAPRTPPHVYRTAQRAPAFAFTPAEDGESRDASLKAEKIVASSVAAWATDDGGTVDTGAELDAITSRGEVDKAIYWRYSKADDGC